MNKPVRIVEGYGINHVLVTLQGVQLLSGHGVPQLACPVIASCDKASRRNVSTSQSEDGRELRKTSFFAYEIITPLFGLFFF
jgi:hypothetical protein